MRLIIMFAAIVLSAAAFFIVMHYFTPPKEPVVVKNVQPTVVQTPTTNIYMARQDIPIGTQIKPEMLDIQPWPQHLLLPDMVQANPGKPSDLVKMVTRAPFQRGEPIIKNMLANENDPGYLAAALSQGMRAVTVQLDAYSAVGGFIYPGDRVDILLTHDVKYNNGLEDATTSSLSGGRLSGESLHAQKGSPVSEMLISNVRVLAMNQRIISHSGDAPIPPASVTLEVSLHDAEKLRLTEGNGRLSLALRSLKDFNLVEPVRPAGINDLSHLTPPAYFPVIYGDDGKPMYASPYEEAVNSSLIVVTRGVQMQEVGVSRP